MNNIKTVGQKKHRASYTSELNENKKRLNKLADSYHAQFLCDMKKNKKEIEENSYLFQTKFVHKLIKEGCKIIDLCLPSNATRIMGDGDPFVRFVTSIAGAVEELMFLYKGELYSLVYNEFAQRADLCKEVIFGGRIERSKDINEMDSVSGDAITHGFKLDENTSAKLLLQAAQKLKFGGDLADIINRGGDGDDDQC